MWYFVASFSLVQFMLLVVQKITEATIIPVLLTKIEDVPVQNFPSRSSILPSYTVNLIHFLKFYK